MPMVYKFITAVLALTGCFSLIMTGEMNPVMAVGGIAVIPGYYRYLKTGRHAPSWAVGIFSVLILIVFSFESFISGDIFLAVAHLTISFQAIKSFDLKEPWDHIQVYFMSLLQLIIASELTYSLAFGAVFVLFMILLVTAMVLSHFLKEGQLGKVSLIKPVCLISALTLVTSAVFFVAVPRTSYRFLGKSHSTGIRTAGFSDSVDFGSFGTVKLDPTVIMRIDMNMDIHGPFYWRGLALDYFNGTTWKSSDTARNRLALSGDEFIFSAYDRNSTIEQKIYLEPIDSDIIFGLADIKGIRTDTFQVVADNGKGIYFPRKASRRIQYTINSAIRDEYPGTERGRYLQLPPGMSRIVNLSRDITFGGDSAYRKALLIERYLRKNYKYSLNTSPPSGGLSPIEDFLFVSKRGYCEHYATSMAIMLRAIGIPSRMVTGFYNGEKNLYGGYVIVRQSDAHSWVEALIDGMWKRYDPTPAVPVRHQSVAALFLDSVKMSWTRYVVGFSTSDQMSILRTLSVPFTLSVWYISGPALLKTTVYLVCAACVILCFIYLIFRYSRTRKYGFVSAQYMHLKKILRSSGLDISPSTSPGSIRTQSRGLKAAVHIEEFIGRYEESRFGKIEMGIADRRRYILLLKEIKKVI